MLVDTVTFVVQQRCRDGSLLWTEILSTAERDESGEIVGYHGISRNIDERKQMEEQIRLLAFHDSLTGLPNRRLLKDRLTQTMAASKRSNLHGALMFLDLDNFKPLNDTHGHEAGDYLLIEVANRLRGCVREMDTVARFGGDEFVVMISELESDRGRSTEQAARIAEKIRAAIAAPYLLTIKPDGYAERRIEHRCTASLGVALFLDHEGSEDDVLKWADSAMYAAKIGGRNQIRFHPPQSGA